MEVVLGGFSLSWSDTILRFVRYRDQKCAVVWFDTFENDPNQK